jgi:DinB superfamily
MTGIPQRHEAAPYYFRYIDRVASGDIVSVLSAQLDETLPFLRGISEEKSLHRYAADKWSIRQVLNHVNDSEQVFVFRALWFARGFDGPLPSFEQEISAGAARADEFSWASHVEAFRGIREATLGFFRNLPADAWARSGVASDHAVSVKALAYIVAGHLAHHRAILEERYV